MAKSRLLTHDDYWAIWLGGFFLVVGLLVFFTQKPKALQEAPDWSAEMKTESERVPFKSVEWYQASDAQMSIKGSSTSAGKWLKKLTGKPGGWSTNPLTALVTTETQADQAATNYEEEARAAKREAANLLEAAKATQAAAAETQFENEERNQSAVSAIEAWRKAKSKASDLQKKADLSPGNKVPYLLLLFVVFLVLFGIAKQVAGTPFREYAPGFVFVFLLAVLAYWIAGQAELKAIGLGYAIWAILFGLIISNTIGTPKWAESALGTEFYIKIGLVLLGAEILLGKVLAIGLPGIFVAWVVTPIVLVSTYWFGQKVLGIKSKTLNMTISADMSVCGVSAAVATAAACKASKEELTLAVGLSMVFTSIMMVAMPAFINWVGIPEILGGAWMGGTIDATGAVVAAGAFLGDKALSVAATIKMIQNVLIGVIAFSVAVYFTTRVDAEKGEKAKVGISEIWKRFPKFIIGFLGASILFSFLYESIGDQQAYSLIEQGVIGSFTKNLRGWMFCLAFVSIGLSTNFKALRSQLQGGRPLLLYVLGQSFNLMLTLAMAYLMFYVVFDGVLAKI
ncbi:MAG TPA: putative sulfate exporter family transporter [Saprospiraceae bacterium]|nr:putative sulfate exporter family transporter [Saprospiraceae bacterium]